MANERKAKMGARIGLIACPPGQGGVPPSGWVRLAEQLTGAGIDARLFDLTQFLYQRMRPDERAYYHNMNGFLWHDRQRSVGPLPLVARHAQALLAPVIKAAPELVYVEFSYPGELAVCKLIGMLKVRLPGLTIVAGGAGCREEGQKRFLQEESGGAIDIFLKGLARTHLLLKLQETGYSAAAGAPSPPFPDYQALVGKSRLSRLDVPLTDECDDGFAWLSSCISASKTGLPVEQILAALHYYYSELGISEFRLTGMPLCHYGHLPELCERLAAELPGLHWTAGVLPWQPLDAPLLALMGRAGCHGLSFCPAPSADRLLSSYFAPEATAEIMTNNLDLCRRAGLMTGFSFMVGFPGESFGELQDNFHFFDRNRERIDLVEAVLPLPALPGTKWLPTIEEQGQHFPTLINEWRTRDGNEPLHRLRQVKNLTRHIRHSGRPYGGDLARRGRSLPPLTRAGLHLFDPLTFRDEPFHPHMPGLAHKYSYGAVSLVTGICEIENSDIGVLQSIETGRGAEVGPEVVHLDLTNRCNMDCIACWDRSPLIGREKNDPIFSWTLPLATVKSTIDQLVALGNTRTIKLGGGGEPTMHPEWLEIVHYIRARQRYVELDINTNGSLLQPATIEALIRAEVNLLTVSLWAATEKTYQATHPNQPLSAFTRLIDNLRLLVHRRPAGLPRLFIHNVIMNRNYHELEAMLDLALDIGADEVHFTLVDPVPDKTEELLLDTRQHRELVDCCLRLKKRVNQWNDYQDPQTGKRIRITNFNEFCAKLSQAEVEQGVYDRRALNTIPCYIGYLYARIMADGRVVPCCKGHRMVMGNINERSFADIWNNRRYRIFRHNGRFMDKTEPYFRLMGSADSTVPGCANCDNIMHNTVMHDKFLFYRELPRWIAFKLRQWQQKR